MELNASAKTPAVSIIVPVYNVSSYLDECIGSILRQSFADFELLLIDDGSTDGSGAICDRWAAKDGRIRVFHKANGGVSLARNMGLQQARGEWIAFVDSDDWVDTSMYEKMYRMAVKENAEICICDFYMTAVGAKNRYYASSAWSDDKKASMRAYIESTWTVVWNFLAKRELFRTNNLEFHPGVTYCEDFNLAVKLMYVAGKIVNLREALYYYRQHTSSVVHTLNGKTESDEQYMYLDVIEWFKCRGVYADYMKQLCWRILKSKQDDLLDRNSLEKFIALVPESKKYILSCPYLNAKLKIAGWCLTHRLRAVIILFLWMRTLKLSLSRKKS